MTKSDVESAENKYTTYLERFGKLFAGDERMHPCLLRRPSLDRIQVEQALTEIDKRRPVVEFYRAGSDSQRLRDGADKTASAMKECFAVPFSIS